MLASIDTPLPMHRRHNVQDGQPPTCVGHLDWQPSVSELKTAVDRTGQMVLPFCCQRRIDITFDSVSSQVRVWFLV
jgi:hypothetical protein